MNINTIKSMKDNQNAFPIFFLNGLILMVGIIRGI